MDIGYSVWYREEDYIERPDLKGATGPPWWKDGQVDEGQKIVVMVPANPAEEFYDSDPHPEKTTILRWVTITEIHGTSLGRRISICGDCKHIFTLLS